MRASVNFSIGMPKRLCKPESTASADLVAVRAFDARWTKNSSIPVIVHSAQRTANTWSGTSGLSSVESEPQAELPHLWPTRLHLIGG
jgi:hypothetical protein